MKNFYILVSALCMSFLMQGQSVLHYDFTNSLSEINGIGPDLTVLGNPGIYEQDTLDEVGDARKWAYRFEKNSGFQFDNSAAENFLSESYTIELYFVFDELNSWKRVVDWKNRKTDYGAYVFNGELNFYPYIYSGEAPVVAGEYTYYVITRDSTNEELLIYTDAKIEIILSDTPGDALLDEDNVLNFFYDDLVVPNEASPGAVAMLKLYNYTMDSTTVKNNFDDLAGNLFYIGEHGKKRTSIQVYPNPVNDRFTVDLSSFEQQETVSIKLVNTIGQSVFETTETAGNRVKINLNIDDIPKGIYVLFVESDSRQATSKLLIR